MRIEDGVVIFLFCCVTLALFVYLKTGMDFQLRKASSTWTISMFLILPSVIFIIRNISLPQYSQFAAAAVYSIATIFVIVYQIITRTHESASRSSSTFVVLIISGLLLAELTNGRPFSVAYLATIAAIVPLLIFRSVQLIEILPIAALSVVSVCGASLAVLSFDPSLVTTNYSTLNLQLTAGGRFIGPFLHPNAIGTIAALSTPIVVFTMHRFRRMAAISILGCTVLISDQRSAWLAFLLALLLPLILRRRAPLVHWYFVTIGTMFVILTLTFFTRIGVESFMSYRVDSVTSRLEIYSYLFGNLTTILPLGIGSSGIYETTSTDLSGAVAHAHNAWLTYFAAGGLLAGVGLVCMFVRSLAVSAIQEDRGKVTMVVVAACLSLVESPSFSGSNWTLVPVAFLALAMWCVPAHAIRGHIPKSVFGRASPLPAIPATPR